MSEFLGLKLEESDIKEKQASLKSLIFRFRWPLVVALTGILFIGIGALALLWPAQKDQVEILTQGTDPANSADKIWADITGAVQKPGVYQLQSGSRINDLLIAAGGLSATADRNWVDRNLNRAAPLTDGTKYYIPEKGETVPINPASATTDTTSATSTININQATQSQLESLWGIGPVTATKIIADRPYSRPEELLEKKLVKTNVWEKIKDQISVY